MKRTLKCAVAMAGAAAVMIGASVPAGAFNVKTQTIPCYSCGNSSEAGNVNSIIKNILEKGCGGSDCTVSIKDIFSSPSCGNTNSGGCGNTNSGSCGSNDQGGNTGNTGNTAQKPVQNDPYDFNKIWEMIMGGSGSVTKPDGNTSKPDDTVSKPDNTTKPDTSITKPGTGNTAVSVSEYEKEVVRLVNEIRAENGLNELTLNTELSDIARLKSQDMRDKGYFSHTSPTYGSPFDMMKSFGVTYKSAGENIAMGYSTPEAVVDGWMNSKGHRENILNSSYKEIGVGYVSSGSYWTQMFIG